MNDAVVWAIAMDEVSVLLAECTALLAERSDAKS